MNSKKSSNWLAEMIASYKNDPEYQYEEAIIELTEEICKKMKEKNINRTELARRLGVSPAAVTKILRGNANFKLKTMLALSRALDTDLSISFKEKGMFGENIIKIFPTKSQGMVGVRADESVVEHPDKNINDANDIHYLGRLQIQA